MYELLFKMIIRGKGTKLNEIEIYLSLVDDEEIDKILKYFKQNVRSNSLELKKTKIRTIVRMNHSIQQKKVRENPFTAILMRHKLVELQELNEREFLITINSKSNSIPDHIKFANLILKFPSEKDKYIKLINSNLNNNKYIFDFNISFNNKDEIDNYITKISLDKEAILDRLKISLDHAIEADLLSPVMHNLDDIRSWNIVRFYNELGQCCRDDNSYLKLEYMRTHNDIDNELLAKWYLDISTDILSLFEENYTDKNYILEMKEKIDEAINNLKKIEKQKEQEIKEHNDIVKKLKKDLTANKLCNEELEKLKTDVKRQSVENEQLIKQLDMLKVQNDTLSLQLQENKIKVKDYHTKITDIEQYCEYNFPINASEEKIFGIILSTRIKIARIIFKEVEFMYVDNWKNQINNVKRIYIQNEGIETKERNKIRKYCTKNGIDIIETISVIDEKRLIEIISNKKNKYEVI